MQSLTVLAFVLLSAVVLGSMAQYGGYAPKPISYQQHAVRTPAPASVPGYGKAGHAPCGALLLFDCAPEIVHAPCVPGHSLGGHGHAGYRAMGGDA